MGRRIGCQAGARCVGRPSKFRPEYCVQAHNLCLMGLTDKELALFFEVNERTLNSWKKAFPEFLQSIKAAKDLADGVVVRKLYERAVGYEHEETDVRTVSRPGPNGGSEVVLTQTVKRYPPDVAAIAIWLRNRQHQRWKDQRDQRPNSDPAALAQRIRYEMLCAEPEKGSVEGWLDSAGIV